MPVLNILPEIKNIMSLLRMEASNSLKHFPENKRFYQDLMAFKSINFHYLQIKDWPLHTESCWVTLSIKNSLCKFVQENFIFFFEHKVISFLLYKAMSIFLLI